MNSFQNTEPHSTKCSQFSRSPSTHLHARDMVEYFLSPTLHQISAHTHTIPYTCALSVQSVIFSVVIKCLIDVKNLCFKLLPFKMFANFPAQKLNEQTSEPGRKEEGERGESRKFKRVYMCVCLPKCQTNWTAALSLFHNNYAPLNTHFSKWENFRKHFTY